MKKVIFLFLLVLLPTIFAICEEGQIDINSASLEELDRLQGIGPAKAQSIIDTRPFLNVNDLINVPGIGEVTLSNIIEQGLACVEASSIPEEPEESPEEEEEEEQEQQDQEVEEESNQEIHTININSPIQEDLKQPKQLNKQTYFVILLITFCLILGLLFMLNKPKRKNEFRDG